MVLFSLLYSLLSYLRYLNFYTSNWDFGIMQQMLWTGSHGYLLYESANYVHVGALSFLEIHSAYIAVPISYIYGVFPSPFTLFIIQALVVTSSIVPIMYITRDYGLSRRTSYLISLIYLTNFGIIAALLYDFHWESFLPVEFFTTFLLMLRKQYRFAVVLLILGDATLEVFPFLMIGIVLFFMAELHGKKGDTIWAFLRSKDGIWLTLLFVLSVISYIVIRVLERVVIPMLVNQPPSLSSVTGDVTSLFTLAPFSLHEFIITLFYWALIFLSMGFVSILYPRHILLALPWIFNTFLLFPSYSSSFGNQYTFIAVPPIFLGLILSLKKYTKTVDKIPKYWPYVVEISIVAFFIFYVTFLFLQPSIRSSVAYNSIVFISISLLALMTIIYVFRKRALLFFKWLRHLRASVDVERKMPAVASITLFAVLIIILNLALGPLNTGNFELYSGPSYEFQWQVNKEYPFALQLASQVPSNATVLASDNLFPYVANNPNAFSLYWFPFEEADAPYFPFNKTNLPDFVFVDASQYYLPQFLINILENGTQYGLVSLIHSNSYPGSIYLYEKGYVGQTRNVYISSN